MKRQEIRDRRMQVLLELVGVDEAEKLGVSAFSQALDRLDAIDARHAEEVEFAKDAEIAALKADRDAFVDEIRQMKRG